MFHLLKNRYILEGCIYLKGSLAVSTGESNKDTDAPVMKRKGDAKPFIPGSSFRGAFRALVERLLMGLGVPVCGLGANPEGAMCLSVNPDEQAKLARWMEQERPTESEVASEVREKLCPACRVFGSTQLASRLKVSDLTPCPTTELPVVIRHRVGIDRDSNTARSGAKFDGEVVETGAFKMELLLENADDQAWGLLGLGLLELRNGDFWIGGDLSVGAGRCRLDNFTIHGFGESGYGLREFLLSTENGLARYRQKIDPWDFITDKVRAIIQPISQEAGHAQGAGESV